MFMYIDHRKLLAANTRTYERLQSLSSDARGSLDYIDLPESCFDHVTYVKSTLYSDLYKATCRLESRGRGTIAIKRLRVSKKEDLASIFTDEIPSWSKLDHPNILAIFGYAFDSFGCPLILSDWMENGSAWAYVNSHPDCDPLHIVTGIARGLEFLHSRNAVHSGIKPDNVLVSSSGNPMICDFGISRLVASIESLQNLSLHVGFTGTIRYLAYEVFTIPAERMNYTMEMDVWAFGMTAYELLTLKQAFQGLTEDEIFASIIAKRTPSFPASIPLRSSLRQENVGSLQTICRDCWEPDRNARIDMGTVLKRLESIKMRANSTPSL